MQVFYQIKYLHTKLYFWCQAGSPIFFFFPFASFFQPPLPTLPPPPTMIQTVFVHKKNLKSKPFIGGGGAVCYLIYCNLSQWLQWQKCSCKLRVKAGGAGGLSLWVTHPVAFGRKMLFPFPFKIFLVEVDMGWGLGRLLIQVLGWRVKHLDYLFNTFLRHPFPPDVTW